jgi:hypothetical protein
MAKYRGWIDQLVYYKDESKPIRSLDLTIEDVNKFLKENKIKTASEFSRANNKYYAKSVRAGWLSLLEYYEDYLFEVTQNITLERLNKYILENKFDPHRAIGAEQLCAVIRGDTDIDTAINNWITKTNQYAKRQRTWFRTQFFADFTINHIPNAMDIDSVLSQTI